MNAVNLLPAKHRPRRPTGGQQGSAYVVVGILGGLLVMVVLYVLTVNAINSRKTQVATANAETAAAQARASALAPYGDRGRAPLGAAAAYPPHHPGESHAPAVRPVLGLQIAAGLAVQVGECFMKWFRNMITIIVQEAGDVRRREVRRHLPHGFKHGFKLIPHASACSSFRRR